MVPAQSLWLHLQQVQLSQRYCTYTSTLLLKEAIAICNMCPNLYKHDSLLDMYWYKFMFPSFFYIFYSQLDTLSKDDLIKFSKKQMAAMQKMKARCAGSCKCCKNLCLYFSLALWASSVQVCDIISPFRFGKRSRNPQTAVHKQ